MAIKRKFDAILNKKTTQNKKPRKMQRKIFKLKPVVNSDSDDSDAVNSDSDSDVDEEQLGVFMKNNHIYYRCPITEKNINKLESLIRKANKQYKILNNKYQIAKFTPNPIYLHIMSHGGLLLAGFRAADFIKNSKIPIYTVVEGYAMSAATLLSMAGKKRYMNKNSVILVHQLSSGAHGTFENLKDDQKNNELLMEKLKVFYLEHSNNRINLNKLNELLKRDLYLDIEKCQEYGIVDEEYKGDN